VEVDFGRKNEFMQKTYSVKAGDIVHDWVLYDADNLVLGRLATVIAHRLRGKHKPTFSPHLDVGDFVVVVNAEKVRVTGGKEKDKMYHRHSGYPGGLRSKSLGRLRAESPERIIQLAVRGMLPKGPLGRQMLSKLKIYAGAEHPHSAQRPVLQTTLDR
jgi:large subunit ribosomal protein L13